MTKTFLAVGAVTVVLMAGSAMAKETDTEAQLREALRQKMAELSGQPAEQAAPATITKPAAPAPATPASTPTFKPAPPTPAAPAATPTAATSVAPGENPLTTPVAQDDPDTAKMREALYGRLAQEAAKPTKPPGNGYAPLTAPALPLSGTKEQRLQQLLEQYKADLITPSEYHAQRAKVIAD